MPSQRVADDFVKLQRYIEGGQFSDHDRLPPERELATALGLTRTRLRTGLRKLEIQGVVWRHVGKGTFYGRRT